MSEYSNDEIFRLFQQSSPKSRRTRLRRLDGTVAEDGVAYVVEEMDMMEPDNTVRHIEMSSSRSCSFGHVLDEKTRIRARAQCCGAIVCDAEGCTHVCSRCHITLCRNHVFEVDGKEYCSRCRRIALLRLIVLGRRKEKQE